MLYLQNLKVGIIFVFAALLVTISVTSCSDDEDEKEIVYFQDYVQGRINNYIISMNLINAEEDIEKSYWNLCTGNQTDIPAWFNWKLKMVETEDKIITLYLHIDDLNKAQDTIYSPNDADLTKNLSTCYATVKDLKNDTTIIYHPTHANPVFVKWETFMMTVNNEYKNLTKQYDYKLNFVGHRWPGIEGELDGTLTCDDASKVPLKIKMYFTLF